MLEARFPGTAAYVARESAAGCVLASDGAPLDPGSVLAARQAVWMYRELPDEIDVPFPMPILFQDERIVVVDKPHFLATMPRGARVVQSALVRLRRELDEPRLSPAHRLDRLTAGVLLFTRDPAVRGPYQQLFATGVARKEYAALAPLRAPSTTERGAATTEADERRPVRVTRVCSSSAMRRRSRRSAAAEASAARRPATIEVPSSAVGSRAGHHGSAVTRPSTQAPSETPSRTLATIPRCEAATRRRSRPWA